MRTFTIRQDLAKPMRCVAVCIALLVAVYFVRPCFSDDSTSKWASSLLETVIDAARGGDASAQAYIGRCCINGHGVQKDPALAVEWYRKAADQGNNDAQYDLGTCYYTGQGVEKNVDEATKWYARAGDNGHPEAAYSMGALAEQSGNIELAKKWYEKAVANGHPSASAKLQALPSGSTPAPGSEPAPASAPPAMAAQTAGVSDADRKQLAELRAKAEQGDAKAQYELGRRCENPTESLKWFLKAAEQNVPGAQLFLSNFYTFGRTGVATDKEKAEYWRRRAHENYLKAAEQNDADAQFYLGITYLNTYLVVTDRDSEIHQFKDNAEAYKWTLLGALSRFGRSAQTQLVMAGFTKLGPVSPEQIAEGERRAEEWLKQHGLKPR